MALGSTVGAFLGGGLGGVSGGPVGALTGVAGALAGASGGAALGLGIANALEGIAAFSSSDDGVRRKPGSLGRFKGRDALRRENRMVRDVVKELGLTRDQQQQFHREISGQGIDDYQELLRYGREMFDIEP